MKKHHGWWHEFFAEFRPVFDAIPPKMTNAVVRYIIRKLGLREAGSFLDCPCGVGRIAVPLAKKGIRVVGVDFMQPFLDELDTKAKRLRLPITTVRSDMRRIRFNNQFDACGNLWTSVGFFSKESDNLQVIKKMFQALKPGGKFVVQTINRDYIVSHFAPAIWYQVDNVRILEENKFDYETSAVIGEWHFVKGDKETVRSVLLRVYSCHELAAMFKRAGFVDVHASGSTRDEPVSYERKALFVFGTKPKG